MLKTVTAALVAASLLVAPTLSVSAQAAQPAAKPGATTTVKPVKLVKHKRHVVKHHKRIKHVRHARHVKAHITPVRHGAKAHKHVVRIEKPAARIRAN